MADKLIVENFGPITQRTELDIKKTTVFIGPQGSGKSTLAKLVAIFCEKGFLNQVYNNDKDIFKKFNLLNFFSEKNDTYLNFQTETHSIILENNTAEVLEKSIPDSKITEKRKIELGLIFASKPLHTDGMEDFIKEYPEAIYIFNSFISLYIPAERAFIASISESSMGLIRSGVALPKTLIDFGADYEIARKSLQSVNIKMLDVIFNHSNGKDIIKLQNGKEINLSESASGYQSLIPLIVYLDYFYGRLANKKFFIVEEPELNLYPITQKKLTQYLIEKSNKSNDQLLMTTHSPYVLSSLNLLIFAYQTAQKHPEQIEAIKAIVPQESWINPDEFAAYFVDEGTARSIINPKTGMIAENELDGVSDLIGDEFDALKRIYISKKYATAN